MILSSSSPVAIRLPRPHPKIFSQRTKAAKLSEDQIDDFKSVKSLKRALLEREISQGRKSMSTASPTK